MNKYYIVLKHVNNSQHITGDVIFDGGITSNEDIECIKEMILKHFNRLNEKDKWFVLNWKELGKEK